MKTLGEMIADLRNQAGLTQSQLAFECGWNKSRLSNYEQGTRTPKLPDLQSISSVLDKQLGAHTIVEFVTGKPLAELVEDRGFITANKFKIEDAIKVFTKLLADGVELGDIKLRPGVTQMSYIKNFSGACVQLLENGGEKQTKKAR